MILSEVKHNEAGNLIEEAEMGMKCNIVSKPIYELETILLKTLKLLNSNELWLDMTDVEMSALFSQAKTDKKTITAVINGFQVLITRTEFGRADLNMD